MIIPDLQTLVLRLTIALMNDPSSTVFPLEMSKAVLTAVRRWLRRILPILALITAFASTLTAARGSSRSVQDDAPASGSVAGQAAGETSTIQEQIESVEKEANAALRVGKLELAQQRYQAVLQLDPRNATALTELGVISYSHHDCATAVRDLRSALHSSPQLTQAQALLGICEKRLSDPQANKDLQVAFANLPSGNLRIEVGVELADLSYQRGDMDATLPVLQKLLTLAPNNTDILFFAQRIYSEQADSTLNKLLLLAPNSARTQQLIAERLINSGNARDAIGYYQKALAMDPHLPGMHLELAEAYMQLGNNETAWQQAREQLTLAQDNDGDSAAIETALGTLDQKQGDRKQAQAHFERAHHLSPEDSAADLNLGALWMDEGKPEIALPLLRAAVQNDPMNPAAHYRLARLCHQLHLASEEALQLRLYREIQKAKDGVALIHQQMNRQPDTTSTMQDKQQ